MGSTCIFPTPIIIYLSLSPIFYFRSDSWGRPTYSILLLSNISISLHLFSLPKHVGNQEEMRVTESCHGTPISLKGCITSAYFQDQFRGILSSLYTLTQYTPHLPFPHITFSTHRLCCIFYQDQFWETYTLTSLAEVSQLLRSLGRKFRIANMAILRKSRPPMIIPYMHMRDTHLLEL